MAIGAKLPTAVWWKARAYHYGCPLILNHVIEELPFARLSLTKQFSEAADHSIIHLRIHHPMHIVTGKVIKRPAGIRIAAYS